MKLPNEQTGKFWPKLKSAIAGQPAMQDTGPSDISDGIRRWIIVGAVTLVCLVGGVGGWMAYASISGAVIAQGTVSVETNVKTVQHLEGGIVGEILVEDGDRVAEGDVLVRLDDTVPKINLAIINDQLNELYAENARLEAELSEKAEIEFPETLLSQSEDPAVASILAAQRNLMSARRDSRKGQVDLLNQNIQQLKEEISGYLAQRASQQKQSDLIARELASLKPLQEQGLISQQRFLALEREGARLEGMFGDLSADISRAEGQIRETGLKINQLEKEFLEEALTNVRENRVKISELEERRLAFQEQLRHIDIRAPQDGLVHDLQFHTIGGVISPASPILQIIPVNDKLNIDARVSPNDIDNIKIGQAATIRFSAFNTRTTPELSGVVIGISPERVIDQSTGESYYKTEVEIGEGELTRLESRILVPGMPAEIFIRTQDRTAWSYLVKPLTDQLARAFREE